MNAVFGFENTQELNLRTVRDVKEATCPGGIGNFGFNSYDLLTFSLLVMGAVSSAVIVNTNKNENNDNNNDLQASFGEIQTNNQMASADQMNTNMAVITVSPAGTPTVAGVGRMLADGSIELMEDVQVPGVSWDSQNYQFYDDGRIFDKLRNQSSQGVIAFGTIDERNVFHKIPNLSWKELRRKESRSADAKTPAVIPFDDKPVFVPVEELNELFEEAIEKYALKLVQITVPTVGPPIVLPIGALLQDGAVYLNDGMEVPGIYWESPDRILYENGTVLYKLTETKEVAQVIFATLNSDGTFDYLPKATLESFRRLNSKPGSRPLQVKIDTSTFDQDTWTSIRQSKLQTRKKRSSVFNLTNVKQILSLAEIIEPLKSQEATKALICSLANQDIEDLLSNYKPQFACFSKSVLSWCRRF